MSTATRDANELGDLLGPFWSEARASAALDASPRHLAAAQKSGAILRLQTADGAMLYPIWQFQRDSVGQIGVRVQLAAMFGELVGHDPWTVAVLIQTPSPELSGLTPLEAARSGARPDTLGEFARIVAREWSAGTAREQPQPLDG